MGTNSELGFEPVNDITLVGRLSGAVSERNLPSGDVVLTCRLVVPRDDGRVDTLDCAVWSAALRRRVNGWHPGDVIELHGALHRRFWQSPTGPNSRYEVTVHAAKRVARAA